MNNSDVLAKLSYLAGVADLLGVAAAHNIEDGLSRETLSSVALGLSAELIELRDRMASTKAASIQS